MVRDIPGYDCALKCRKEHKLTIGSDTDINPVTFSPSRPFVLVLVNQVLLLEAASKWFPEAHLACVKRPSKTSPVGCHRDFTGSAPVNLIQTISRNRIPDANNSAV
jgi:hypothetical protein